LAVITCPRCGGLAQSLLMGCRAAFVEVLGRLELMMRN